MTQTSISLLSSPGTGSAMIEALLTLTEAPFELEVYDWELLGPNCMVEKLLALNSLGQIPTLVLADGTVMTETAAITIYLAEHYPQAALAPPPGDPNRPTFLRWLVFLGSAFYATFTYGDFPERWVEGETASASLAASTLAHREKLWRVLDREAVKGPWFLGESFSALDVFISVMSRWRPRRKWIQAHCPKVAALATRLDQDPRLTSVWQRNFG